MQKIIEEAKELFDSITCLCAEGPEFMQKLELIDAIGQEAVKGYILCKENIQPKDSAECQDHACRKMAKYERKYSEYCGPDSDCFIR